MERTPITTNTRPNQPTSPEAGYKEPTLEMTAEENEAAVWLETDKATRHFINENYVVPSLNKTGEWLDKTRNIKATATKKALLLDYREGRTQDKIARLKAKMEGLDHNSGRYRRLSRKIGNNAIKLGDIRYRSGNLRSSIENRADVRERINSWREAEAYIQRQLLLVAKKVRHEQEERQKLKKDIAKATSPGEREERKAVYEARCKEPISVFREKLIKEVVRNADKLRVERKRTATLLAGATEEASADTETPMESLEEHAEREFQEFVDDLGTKANQAFINEMDNQGDVLGQYEKQLEFNEYLEEQLVQASTPEEKARWQRALDENDKKMDALKRVMDRAYDTIDANRMEDEAHVQNDMMDALDSQQ